MNSNKKIIKIDFYNRKLNTILQTFKKKYKQII